MRHQLLDMFQIGLDAVQGEQCVQAHLSSHELAQSECTVVAIGKAAQKMAVGSEQVLADKLVKGLLITKYEHAVADDLSDKWQVIEAAHPVPDKNSLAAGKALLDFIQHHDYQQYPVIFLISGGASSLVEVLAEQYDHNVLQQVNDWLLSNGLAIGQMNRVRKAISQIKGGKLLQYLQGRKVHALLISDVPGDYPHVIGSGLLFPYHDESEALDLPSWLLSLISDSEKVSPDIERSNVSHQIIASNQIAKQAIKNTSQLAGQKIHVHDDFLEGDAAIRGRELASYLLNTAEPGIHIWGGETTVSLPDNPGRGGRNQHLALSAAEVLHGNHNITLLAAGTDGTDGPTCDAGAIVDGGTLSRGELSGLNARQCLHNADSGSFLEAAGDLLSTGPTGTNVMDLVIAIKSD